MKQAAWPATVGVIGVGIMGSAFARNLAERGWNVIGFDTDAMRRDALAASGVGVAASAAAVAAGADVLLTSLPSEEAFAATVDAIIGAPRRPGQVVVELSTLSLEAKQRQQQRLSAVEVVMLDCPVSGTGAQAATRDLVVLVSGDEASARRCQPVLADLSRSTVHLGAFGNGTKMKFVANLLVAIHNVAAAEAISLGIRSGLDPATLCDVLSSGAGNSRMLEVRGPMMVREVYQPATMKLAVWLKDMRLIKAFASSVGSATPLFDATAPLYQSAVADGRGDEDTAAVRSVLERLSPIAPGD